MISPDMTRYYFDDHERKLDSWAKEKMSKYGWFAHFVPEDDAFPNSINYHTHGIEHSFGHPDLQICFPLPPDVAHQIFTGIVDKIKTGIRFRSGTKYPEIIGNDLSVEFIDAMEGERKLLRIIFPDKNGTYNGEMYERQFEMTGI